MYVRSETGAPVTLHDISQRLNVSLPQEPSKEVLDDLGIEKIIQVPAPSNIHRQGPLKRINGHWTETWDEPSPGEIARAEREKFKTERTAAVQAITVTTPAGNTFDGDEISQWRMARAILSLQEGQTVRWVLHDNTEIDATAAELREALALAGAEQARLWVMDKTTQNDQ